MAIIEGLYEGIIKIFTIVFSIAIIVFKLMNFSYGPQLLPYIVIFDMKFFPCIYYSCYNYSFPVILGRICLSVHLSRMNHPTRPSRVV